MGFPFLAGVPPLKGNYVAAAVTLGSGVLGNLLDMLNPTWVIYNMKSENKKTGVSFSLSSGIKKTGGFEPAIEPDSFHGIDFTNNFNVSTYPIENGGFASYNKIHTPFNLKVTVAVGGDDAKKEKFISTLDAMSNSIEYFGLITPAGTYKNLTVERYDYKRELKNGLGILVVAISFVQIMEAISTTAQAGKVGSPATPSASPSQSLGNTSGAVKP